MEKQKIIGISNREEYICYTLDKNEFYYAFLTNLLKEFDVKHIPDFYDDAGKLSNPISEFDSMFYWDDNSISIIHVIGYERIFLFVKTNLRDKLNKFMENNCEFN